MRLNIMPSTIWRSDSNSTVSKPRIPLGSTSTSSILRDNVSAHSLSIPFRCSMAKSMDCSWRDHRAKRPSRFFMVMSHLRLAWSVMTVNGRSSRYGRNFRIAIRAARLPSLSPSSSSGDNLAWRNSYLSIVLHKAPIPARSSQEVMQFSDRSRLGNAIRIHLHRRLTKVRFTQPYR